MSELGVTSPLPCLLTPVPSKWSSRGGAESRNGSGIPSNIFFGLAGGSGDIQSGDTGAGQRHPRVGLLGSKKKSRALGPETHDGFPTLGALALGGYLMAGASPSRVPGLV